MHNTKGTPTKVETARYLSVQPSPCDSLQDSTVEPAQNIAKCSLLLPEAG